MCHLASRIRAILELEVLPLDGDGVVEEELRDAFENLWENIPREVLIQRIRGVGDRKAMFLNPVLEKMADRVERADSVPTLTRGTVPLTRTRTAVSSEGVDDLLDLIHNNLLEEFVCVNIAGVRRVEDANLGRGCFSS